MLLNSLKSLLFSGGLVFAFFTILPAAEPEQPGRAVLKDRVQAQLRAGEFGPALKEALENRASDQRAQTLHRIAAAQQQAGELAAAARTTGYLPPSPKRSQLMSSLAAEQSRTGGTGADFDSLIQLIQSTVQPDMWQENGGNGTIQSFEAGIRVDPQGVLRQVPREEARTRLSALAQRSRQADLNADMARKSSLRIVSLRRLEKEVAARLAAGQPVLETMQRMAGLTRLQYIFIDPLERDVIIAGPAEGWEYEAGGRAIGRESQTPILQLDDLVTVLRTFSSGGRGIFGCSINPRAENLKLLKEFVERQDDRGPLSPGAVRRWVQELQRILGEQDVEVYGVPNDSHVASVLVEADYRMKLIGVHKLDGGPQVPSYFDLLNGDREARQAPLAALRWWMTMKYTGIQHSPDRLTFEIEGPAVQVLSENQFINGQGEHLSTGKAEPLNRQFASNFTTHYDKVARQYPVFAELRNIFDKALVAALLQQERIPQQIDWDLGVFGPRGSYQVQRVVVPKTVESVAHHRVYDGKEVVVQVAGGVRGDLSTVASNQSLQKSAPTLSKVSEAGKRPSLPPNRWWWDATKQ